MRSGFKARMLYRIDRLFPRARVGGRESGADYAAWEHEIGRTLLTEYTDRFGSLEGRRVLDIGCGFGGKTVAYAQAGADVTGVDISPEKIEEARAYARRFGAVCSFVAGDAGRLPFADGAFDLVIANDSLEHFHDPDSALRELVRVARAGGEIFLFFTPWGSPLGSHLYDYIRTPWCHLLYSESTIEKLLEEVLERRGGTCDPAAEAARLMGEYHSELNRITVRRYRRILDSIPDIEVVWERLYPPKFAFLSPLIALPLLGELFTGTVVALLRKTNSGGGHSA